MNPFYVELAHRAVALADAYQYERAAQLLCIALDAVDWQVKPPPERLRAAWGDLQSFLNMQAEEDAHEYFEEGIRHLEAYLAETETPA